jgi:hypothetical protein
MALRRNAGKPVIKIEEGRETLVALAAAGDGFGLFDIEVAANVAAAIVSWLFHGTSCFLPHVYPLRIARPIPPHNQQG